MIQDKKITLDFLGGAMEVGASCILAEIGGYRVLLDCGIRQKAGADPLPDLRRLQERGGVDAIVVSHAHMDHTGTLPVVSKAYPNARIYATSMTIDETRVLLYDSIKLMNRQEEGIPVYAVRDVEDMFTRIQAVHYERPLEILPGLTLTLYQAGHIAGAACIFLQSKDGSLFYSGDFSGFAQNAIEGIRIPKLRPDVAIVESTYGDRLHANRQIEEGRLVELVRECIEKKGKMIIPAFALGRAQEVLLILRKAMNKGELPKVRIYVDGMVRDMNTAFERNPWYLKNALARRIESGNRIFYSDEIVEVAANQNRDQLLETSEPVIFVASSGMLTGGPSAFYAQKIAPMENGYLVITGYQDEEAPGRMVQQLLDEDAEEKYLMLDGVRTPVRCRLAKVGLSAHGDQGEIRNLLERLSSRHVFLVHGDPEVIGQLAGSLDLDYRTRIYAPKDGEQETVYLRSPRKQWNKTYPYTMQRSYSFGEQAQDGAELYRYWNLHYPGQRYTIAELAYIWFGTFSQTDEQLDAMQEALLAEPYFARDMRRLFLFTCRTQEEMEKEARKTEWNQQVLISLAQETFQEYEPRRIGYYQEKNEISLQIDFPGVCGEEFRKKAEEYRQATGWKIVWNQEPNEQAMQMYLLQHMCGVARKISIHKQKQLVTVKVDEPGLSPEAWQELKQEFGRLTGYALRSEGESETGNAATALGREEQLDSGRTASGLEEQFGSGWVVPDRGELLGTSAAPLEQNLAFSCIEAEFVGAVYKPYKKSIKTDDVGRYMELSFLSPALGRKEEERISRLAAQTGWRFHIAESVNQNAIQNLAVQTCARHAIPLKKLPSYQPQSRSLLLRTDAFAGTPEQLEEVQRELEGEVGLEVRFE